MIRMILKWTDKKYEEALDEDGMKLVTKAFISGFVEGAVDVFFDVSVIFTVIGIWKGIKARKIK